MFCRSWPFTWRRVPLALAAAFITLACGVGAVSGYSAWALSRAKRFPLVATPATFGLPYSDVSFTSMEDGVPLKGWFIPAAGSQRVVIIVHGKDGNRAKKPESAELPVARALVRGGFSVLMFDLRGHGESGGDRFSLGEYEERDVRGAVAYVRSRGFAGGAIGVLGFSMGGAAAILAASRAPEVGAVVADSAFASAREMVDKEFPKESGLPAVFIPPTVLAARVLQGMDIDSVSPERAMAEIRAPVFVIHGLADDLVPVSHARRNFAASRNPASELWIIPGATHNTSYQTAGDEYLSRVTAFFERHLR